jgi:hypothetical protein
LRDLLQPFGIDGGLYGGTTGVVGIISGSRGKSDFALELDGQGQQFECTFENGSGHFNSYF